MATGITVHINTGDDANSIKLNEKLLDYNTIFLCRQIINHHPVAKKCLEAIYNRLFKYGMEIKMGNKRVPMMSGMRDFFSRYYIPFCKEFIQCYYEMGIVPVSIAKTRSGERVPVVMKEMGYITIYSDPVTKKSKTYQFYKLYSKKTLAILPRPKLDKSTVIFHGYGNDPDVNGGITSIIASAIPKVVFTEKMFSCAYSTEISNSRPPIITQIVEPNLTRTGEAMGTNTDINLWYGNADRQELSTDAKIQYDRQDIRIMEQYNRHFIDFWNNMLGEQYKVSGHSPEDRPPPMSMFNLPAGHVGAANIPRPVARNDLLDVDLMEQRLICDLLGVSENLFNSNYKTSGGIEQNSQMFLENLTEWRSKLSGVLTPVFKDIYNGKVKELYKDKVVEKIKKKTTKGTLNLDDDSVSVRERTEQIAKIVNDVFAGSNLRIEFPFIPNADPEQLFTMYLRGAIEYGDYVAYTKMASGMTVEEEDRKAKPPWNDGKRVMMMMQTLDGPNKMLFEIRTGITDKPQTEKDKSDKDKKKKKKKEKKKRKKDSDTESEPEKKKKKIDKKKQSKGDEKEENSKEKEKEKE